MNKKPYSTPQLITYGEMAALTQATSTAQPVDGATFSQPLHHQSV